MQFHVGKKSPTRHTQDAITRDSIRCIPKVLNHNQLPDSPEKESACERRRSICIQHQRGHRHNRNTSLRRNNCKLKQSKGSHVVERCKFSLYRVEMFTGIYVEGVRNFLLPVRTVYHDIQVMGACRKTTTASAQMSIRSTLNGLACGVYELVTSVYIQTTNYGEQRNQVYVNLLHNVHKIFDTRWLGTSITLALLSVI